MTLPKALYRQNNPSASGGRSIFYFRGVKRMNCDWCGEKGDKCWCDAVTEDFKNGKTDNDWETLEPEKLEVNS